MKERKSIDRIYQEKFKDFEINPGEDQWNKITNRLDKKEDEEILIIPLWLKLSGVAAVFALFIAGLVYINTESPLSEEPQIVFENPDQDIKTPDNNTVDTLQKNIPGAPGKIVFEDSANTNEPGAAKSQGDFSVENRQGLTQDRGKEKSQSTTNFQKRDLNKSPIILSESSMVKTEKPENSEVLPTNSTRVIEKASENQGLAVIPDSTSVLTKENALAIIEAEKEEASDTDNSKIAQADRLSLSTFGAPVFYKNMGGGNELSNQFSDNNSSSEVTFSYGMKVAYQISDKLSIRTGISKINVNNSIRDISYSPTARAAGFENINPIEDNIDIRDNAPTESGLPMGNPGSNNALTAVPFTPGEINQQFGFIEVPLELEYALIDNRFGLNIIGGASSLFLDNNRVDLISGDSRTQLGKASNINSTSFSTNIGFGMDYKLNKSFSISVEPIFKYQINTFKDVENVQPANIGIYSGLNFRF